MAARRACDIAPDNRDTFRIAVCYKTVKCDSGITISVIKQILDIPCRVRFVYNRTTKKIRNAHMINENRIIAFIIINLNSIRFHNGVNLFLRFYLYPISVHVSHLVYSPFAHLFGKMVCIDTQISAHPIREDIIVIQSFHSENNNGASLPAPVD